MKLTEQMRGVGQVYRFTLIQHLKNKANLISLIVMLLLVILIGPVGTLLTGGISTAEGIPEPDGEMQTPNIDDLTALYLCDESGLAVAEMLTLPEGVTLETVPTPLTREQIEAMPKTALFAHLAPDPQTGTFLLHTYTSSLGELKDTTVSDVSWMLADSFEAAKYSGLTEQEEAWLVQSGSSWAEVGDLEDYVNFDEDVGMGTSFVVEYIYSILMLMLCMMSSSFIIRAVVEEKSSKLIDLLMVSVQPLALLAGKILAMMTVVFGTLLVMLLGSGLSIVITGLLTDAASIGALLSEMGVSFSALDLGVDTVVIVLVSLLLSYLTYSILSGIAGASCSSMNDMEGAMLGVTFTVLAGYIVSSAVAAIPSRAVAIVTSLIPLLSSFCAPVQFVLGRIGWPILLLSWLIQAAMIVLLAKLGAKVYHDLILYQGQRLKWRDILRMAKRKGGVA